MNTIPAAAAIHRVLTQPDEIRRVLNQYHIPHHQWGHGRFKTFDQLMEELRDEQVDLIDNGSCLYLDTQTSRVIVQCTVEGTLYELVETLQAFAGGETICRNQRGLSEKLRRITPLERAEPAAHRCLCEELGQSEPGFKDPSRYSLTYLFRDELTATAKDWPGLTRVSHVCIFRCIITDLSLFHIHGYREVLPHRTTYFEWKEA